MVDCVHIVFYHGVHAAGIRTHCSVYQEVPGAASVAVPPLSAVTVEGQSQGRVTIHLGIGPRLCV